jgi:hypothetical protein
MSRFFFKFSSVPYNLIDLMSPNHLKATGYQHLADILEAAVVLLVLYEAGARNCSLLRSIKTDLPPIQRVQGALSPGVK